jgi:GGDEF domain-containing protein
VGTLSISVGVACRGPSDPPQEEAAAVAGEALFCAADAALYAAKHAGRNGVAGTPPHSFSAIPNRSAIR